ncbi:MAG: glycosyltransferase family 4 protein [Candidatus Heimdallarchaeaceae archaeon]
MAKTFCFIDYSNGDDLNPLHIVQVTPFFESKSYGGTERYVSHLSAELANRGHYVDVFTTKKSTKTPYQSYFHNMTVHRFYSPWNVFGINPACLMLHKLMKAENVDVFHVHSFIYFTTIQAAITRFFKKTPMLLHIHGGVGRPPYRTGFLKEFAKIFYDFTLGRFVLSQADIIASVSQYDLQLLSQFMPKQTKNMMVVNNAIFPENFPEVSPSADSETFILTYLGDLEPWKGIIYYSKVIDKLLKKTSKLSFWFIGDGSLSTILRQKYKNNPRVKLFGAVKHSQVPSLLSKSNLLILPSFWEGSPTTIIEAMSMGIPVAASNIGDIPRLLDNGKRGSLFKVGDISDLERVILKIVSNYDDFVTIAENSRTEVRKEYSFKRVTDLIEKLYYSLANKI